MALGSLYRTPLKAGMAPRPASQSSPGIWSHQLPPLLPMVATPLTSLNMPGDFRHAINVISGGIAFASFVAASWRLKLVDGPCDVLSGNGRQCGRKVSLQNCTRHFRRLWRQNRHRQTAMQHQTMILPRLIVQVVDDEPYNKCKFD
jgi:hypothetical protein